MIGEEEMHNMARILRANFTQENLDVLHASGYTTDQVQEFMDFISTQGTFKTPELVQLMGNLKSRLFDRYTIAADRDSIYLAEKDAKRYNEDGTENINGHCMMKKNLRYLGKFEQASWQILTDVDHDDFYAKSTKQDMMNCGWPENEIDNLADILTHKTGFIPFKLGVLPYRDFPLRAVDWMMIPAVKIEDIKQLYKMKNAGDIVNTSLYTQLFFVNWVKEHVMEHKWDATKLEEKIPHFLSAASIIASADFDISLAYDYARSNLEKVMEERKKGRQGPEKPARTEKAEEEYER